MSTLPRSSPRCAASGGDAVGFAALSGSGVTASASAVESERFGLPVVRVSLGADWHPVDAARPAGEVLEALDDLAWQVAIVRFASARRELVRDLAGRGFTLVPGDTLLYWRQSLDRHDAADTSTDVRTVTSADLALVDRIVERSFDGYTNHYSANPLMAPGDVVAGYRAWARSTASGGGLAFVIQDDAGFGGVATVDAGPKHWEIELAGMEPEAAGRGLYRRLLDGVASAARLAGVDGLLISTQAQNIRVQRVWARAGFVPVAAFDTVHLIAPSAPRRQPTMALPPA